jgi:hypothetical protein
VAGACDSYWTNFWWPTLPIKNRALFSVAGPKLLAIVLLPLKINKTVENHLDSCSVLATIVNSPSPHCSHMESCLLSSTVVVVMWRIGVGHVWQMLRLKSMGCTPCRGW